MNRFKRIFAVLLTAVLTLMILTGCGGTAGSSASYPPSSTAKNAVAAALKQAGFSASPDEQALNAISEKYAKQVARSPESYSSYGSNYSSSPIYKMQSNWISDCKNTITSSTSYSLWGLSPYTGSNSEEDAASYYASYISSSISHFKESISSKDPGTSYYYIYPVHITNPSDPEESIWLMFTVLYLVKN